MTENAATPDKTPDSPGDLFSLLSAFASRMAILSSVSGQENFWEDPTALKVGLATYANARFLRQNLTAQMELAETANQSLHDQIKAEEKACAALESEVEADEKKLRGLNAMVAKDEASGGEDGPRSPMRPRRDILEREMNERNEALVARRRVLHENREKDKRLSGELKKARALNEHFQGLFADCFEKWEVFDDATLRDLAENGPTAEIREMVRDSIEAEPDKIVTISRTDWNSFRRSLDMFMVDNMLDIEAEVVVLADGTLRSVNARTTNIQKSVKGHLDSKLLDAGWIELRQMLEQWDMKPELENYIAMQDNARLFIDADTLSRADEFISPTMQQQILIGVVEWMTEGVNHGYTSFGKEAGFNTLMITVNGFYLLYQWRSISIDYLDSRGARVYTTINAIHVFEIDLVFCNAEGAEIEHDLHDDAKEKLKDMEVDLRRHSTVDGEEEAEPKSALLDRLKDG